MGKYEELTPRQKKRFDEFVWEALFLTEQECAAIDGRSPISQEFFEQCVEHCTRIDAQLALNSLLSLYPEFAQEYVRKAEERLDARFPEKEMAEKKNIWDKICKCMEECGMEMN